MIGDRYRVIRKLGEGGMAIVYLAVDEKLGRNVAVKVLREKFQNHQEIRTRFQHEARAISGFDHVNILKVYDYSGANSPQLWIVTELIHGRNLGQIVETAPGGWLHPVIASCIVRETCKALALSHSEGIVHRDVKPDNVMITQQGVIKLMDFGIAKIQQNNSMTQTGMFMGSPSYMSPEQVRGRDIDHRSDIYSLGILFYELVTGRLPFSGQSTADVAMKILSGQYQHPKFLKEHLPVEINDLIVSMMSLDPAHRPQSTDTVGGIIDKFLERNGFESSHAELDRCFRDPKSYGERLAKLIQQTALVALPTQLIQPQSRMEAATKLPFNERKTQRLVQVHNEAAIDRPLPHVPQQNPPPHTDHMNSPHPAHAVPPPPMRRDHALPRHSLPKVTRKVAGEPDIMAHLPERRLQQRPDQTMVKPRPTAQQQKVMPQQPAQKRAQQPSPQRPRGQQPRPPRSLPRMPHRAAPRYVIHREISTTSSSLPNLLIAVTIVAVGFICYALFADRIRMWVPTSPTNHVTKNQRVKAGVEQKIAIKPKMDAKTQKNDDPKATIALEKLPAPKPAGERKSDAIDHRQQPAQPTQKPKAFTTQAIPPTESSKPVVTAKKTPMPAIFPTGLDLETAKNNDDDDVIVSKPTPKPIEVKSTPAAPAPVGKAAVSVSCNPAAEVYINGKRMGTTNDAGISSDWYDLPSGKLKIELRRTGFASRTEYAQVAPGERKRLGPFTLNKEGQKAPPSSYRLTLSTNITPTQVNVTNYDTKSTKTFTLTNNSQTITLERGVYDVTMTHNGEVRKRRIEMNGAETQLTFSAEYKEESH